LPRVVGDVSKDVDFEELARCTDDFNGAQCKAVCVEAVSCFRLLTYCTVVVVVTRWLYCVAFPQYSIWLEALGYLCTSCLLPAFDEA